MTDGASEIAAGDGLVREAARVGSAQELAGLLRELRRRHARRSRDSELSYRELAARTGWSHAAIAEYLTGRTLPPTDRLDGLLRVFGATAAELHAVATARDRVEESRRSGRTTRSTSKSPSKSSPKSPSGDVWAVPRQLPAGPPHFVGRAAELAALTALAERPAEAGAVVVSTVVGMAGIGKTALAVHAGHRLAARFPDGQLFVDLHGFTAGVVPVRPGQALARLLRDVGVPGERIPSKLEARAALWRSVLADRRMLVVLDNAATAEQVRPLLPGTTGCLVMVTSRRRLAGLDTTHAVSLDPLPQADAVTLFLRTVDRPELTPDTPDVLKVVELCGRLPLAVRIVAARVKHRRVWSVTDLMVRLRDLPGLAAFEDGPRSIHAALHLSYRHLSAAAQRLYRLLGLHPGADADPHAAAAITAGTLDEATRLLDRLVDDHLVQEPSPGRFRFHDLARAHAAEVVVTEEAQAQRHAASTRLLDHYRHAAASAMAVAYPYQRHRRPTVPPALTATPDLDDRKRAQLWLDNEMPNLLAAAQYAAQHGWLEHAWHLSATVGRHLFTLGRHRDGEAVYQHALRLARDLGDHRAEIDALNGLGCANRMLGRNGEAGDHFSRALRIAQGIGDRHGELQALTGLSRIDYMRGCYDRAGDHAGQALRIARELSHRPSELRALTRLGHIHRMLGRYDRATEHLGRALLIAQDISDRLGELRALNGLGSVHRMLGRYRQAVGHHVSALRIAQGIDDRVDTLYAWIHLGELHLLLGHPGRSAGFYRQSLDVACDVDSLNWQFEALQGMGRLHHVTGQRELALTHHEQALEYASGLAQPTDQARAHDGLAYAHRTLDQHDRARRHWRHALDILTGLGIDHTDDLRTNGPSIRANLADLDHGRPPRDRGGRWVDRVRPGPPGPVAPHSSPARL